MALTGAGRQRGKAASAWLLAALLGAACRPGYKGPDVVDQEVPTSDGGAGGPGAPGGCPQGTEALQAQLLAPRCGACHGARTPSAGLDLVSPGLAMRLANKPASGGCPGQVIVVPGDPDRSLLVNKIANASPACGARMPFGGVPLAPESIACVRAWIQGNLPASTGDAGAVVVPPPGPAGMTPGCTIDRYTGKYMCPGRDCLSCHRRGGPVDDEDKWWSAAGTIFERPGDPVPATGAAPTEGPGPGVDRVEVVLTDAQGKVERLRTNEVGNFYSDEPLVFPLHVQVIRGNVVRTMPFPAPVGGCNGCHTQPPTNQGQSIPAPGGRIYIGTP